MLTLLYAIEKQKKMAWSRSQPRARDGTSGNYYGERSRMRSLGLMDNDHVILMKCIDKHQCFFPLKAIIFFRNVGIIVSTLFCKNACLNRYED